MNRGMVLGRRYRQGTALAVAVPLAVLLAAVSVAVAYALTRTRADHLATAPLDDPVLVRVVLSELAAYPLCAAAGVGLSTLLGGRMLVVFTPVLVAGWCATTLTGLRQDDRFAGPAWLLWTVPPIAAATAVALAGLSIDVQSEPPVLVGDWGHRAGIAMLVGAAAYALALNLLGGLAKRRRSPFERSPDQAPPR